MGRVLRRSGNAVTQHLKLLDWEPDIVYQIGVGLHHQEVEAMREQWPTVSLIGCEPHPGIYESIKDTYPGQLLQVAMSDTHGRTRLYLKPQHRDGSSLLPHNSEGKDKTVVVSTTTIDETLPAPADKRILLWLDCEGSELAVLRGATQFLTHVGAINVELTGASYSGNWPSPAEVHNYLVVERDYFLQWTHTNRASAGQFDALYVHRKLFNPQYCNCPPEVIRHGSLC